MKRFIVLVLPIFLSGCFHSIPKSAEESGVPSGEVLLWHPGGTEEGELFRRFENIRDNSDNAPSKKLDPHAHIEKFLAKNPDAKAKLAECYIKPKPGEPDMKTMATDPVVIPFITALAKLSFDSIMDRKARSLDDLKKRSVKNYETTKFMKTQDLRKWSCLGIARITKDRPNKGDRKPGMIALFEIIHFDVNGKETPGRNPRKPDEAFGMRLKPLFVRSFDSVAVTKLGSSDVPEVISLSFALALKGIEHTPDKLPQTVAFGAGTLSVSKVKIGGMHGETKLCDAKACGSTGLIPFPRTSGPLEITMAVTETGNVGFNIDLAKARLAAFKAALGPAISTALKAHLEED